MIAENLHDIIIEILSVAEGLRDLADELGDSDRMEAAEEALHELRKIVERLKKTAPKAVPPSLRRQAI